MMRQAQIQSGGWAPARFAGAPARFDAPLSIGQPMPTPLLPPKKAFIDSAALAAVVTGAGSVASGMIAYTYAKAGSKWASLFWLVSGVMGFVALDDLSRLRGR